MALDWFKSRTKVAVPIHWGRERSDVMSSDKSGKALVSFPERCVYCYGPAEDHKELKAVTYVETLHRHEERLVTLRLPYCTRCRKRARLGRYLMLGTMGAFAVWGTALFIVNEADQHATSEMVGLTLLVAFGGVVVGATLWAFVVRPILWPFIKAVRHTPVLYRDGYLGVKVQVKPNLLLLSFSNEDYASEFALANLGASAIS